MYLLDTNICIFLIKNKFPNLTKKILSSDSEELFLSSVSIAEMEYGVSKSQNREKIVRPYWISVLTSAI
jgi:DNA binding protein with PIN domain protein